MEWRSKLSSEVIVAISTLFTWIAIGTIVFHKLEGWSRIQSFYFSVVTITTVGYGDLSPSSDISRLFAAIYILVGVSIGIVTLSLVGSAIIKYREERYLKKVKKR